MGESLVSRVMAAAETLERLQEDPVTRRDSYSVRDLQGIVRMFNGLGER